MEGDGLQAEAMIDLVQRGGPDDLAVERLADAVPVTGNLVDAIEPGQWELPTPCPDWSVRDVVNHLVFGHRRFAAALTGGHPAGPR